MAKNTFKNQKADSTEKKEKPSSFTLWLARVFNIEEVVLGLPFHYLYYAVWLFFLIMIYIFFSHKYENYVREIDYLKIDLDQKRSEYITKKAGFMRDTKKSEISKKVAPFGLIENTEAPQKIIDENK